METIGFFVFVLGVIVVGVWFKNQRERRAAEQRRLVLERFTNTTELAAFLESEAGRNLVAPAGRSFHPVRSGILFLVLGLGFIGVGSLGASAGAGGMNARDFATLGEIFSLFGAAVVASAALGPWLERRWGSDPTTARMSRRS